MSFDTQVIFVQSYKLKIASTDTTADYLVNKLLAGTGISISHDSIGGDETMTISATGGTVSVIVQAVSGTINGSNTAFTIPLSFTGKSFIDLNGQILVQDVDYTVSDTDITYTTAPAADLSGTTHKLICVG